MNEKLLQYIWRFQYYNNQSLFTTAQEPLSIAHAGAWNHHQGPDFLSASIRIGNTQWVGNIELHVRSSDWHRHHHSEDEAYKNIILHVVWEDDAPVYDPYGNLVSTLVLEPRVPRLLLERYRQMMETLNSIPCQHFLPALPELAWCAWKERLAAERLERRTAQVLTILKETNQHWDEVCWRMLAANFGVKVNTTLFEMVAKTLPVTLLARHNGQVIHLEALLMGQANLLSGRLEDAYGLLLQREYRFLKKKYGLPAVTKRPAFLRMRPAAFPTIRLAQLAMVLSKTPAMFRELTEITDPERALQLFLVTANDYWHYHYRFDEETAFRPKQLGRAMAENILINTIAPLLFAYGHHIKDHALKDRAVQWLYQLAPEKNQLTSGWQKSAVTNRSALDSQALIELTNHYCANRRCLECAVGNGVLKNLKI